MNDFEIKRLADNLADAGLVLEALGEQIRHATSEEDCCQLIPKAVSESAKARTAALNMRAENVAKQKIVGVADND